MRAVKRCPVEASGEAVIGQKKCLSQRKRFIMRKQIYTMIAAVVLTGCLAVSANAQCDDGRLIFKIPFQFSTGNATLPAGEYHITCFAYGRFLLIRSKDGIGHAFVSVNPVCGRLQEGARLVFHRHGSRYFFVQAWAGEPPGWNCRQGMPKTLPHARRRASSQSTGQLHLPRSRREKPGEPVASSSIFWN